MSELSLSFVDYLRVLTDIKRNVSSKLRPASTNVAIFLIILFSVIQ
jgi:hypothetical protein